MFHTQAFWLRTLRLNPLKPFGSRCCVVQVPLPPLPLGGCRLSSTAPRCPGHALRAVVPGASDDGSEGSRESLTMALGASYDGSEGARESSHRPAGSTLSGSRELRTMALRDPGRRQGATYDGSGVTAAPARMPGGHPSEKICVGLFFYLL